MDDVLGTTLRPNVPGTLDERPNWSIPLPLEPEPRVKRVAELVRLP
jgi:4-alpha-glucanotransferase